MQPRHDGNRFLSAFAQRVCTAFFAVASVSSPAVADDSFPPQRKEVPLEAFYDVLRESGTFIETDRHGVAFCPLPDIVGPDFQPFRRGHWVMTEYGWTFTSDLKISWVTDHYGRWVETGLTNCNWAWVPGGQWGPAWVDFRVGEKVVAWRPSPYIGPRVRFRLPEAKQFPKFVVPEIPPNDQAFVVVREGEFQARRLDYVALGGTQHERALADTVPILDREAGLHSHEYEALMAQRTGQPDPAADSPTGQAKAQSTGRAHSLSNAGAADGSEPARRRRKNDTPPQAAGTVRAGLPGADLPNNAPREKQPLVGGTNGDRAPNRTNAATGSSAGNPGEFSGVKVLDFGKPKPTEPSKTGVRNLQQTLPPPKTK